MGVLRNMFRSLVQDEFAPTSAEVNDRIANVLLDMDDPDIVLDLRKLNGKPSSSKFDAFWLELHIYLEEIGPAVQEGRHGEAMYMPVAISVNHLREIISGKLKEKFPQEEVQRFSLYFEHCVTHALFSKAPSLNFKARRPERSTEELKAQSKQGSSDNVL
jgi:hypothetical protein